MKYRIIALLSLLLPCCMLHAEQSLPSGGRDASWHKWGPTLGLKQGGFILRAGYVIGGTTPVPLPEEIRKINEFSPRGGISLGIDGYRMFSKRWGVSIGAHFFWEGFHTSADVKNYYVSYDEVDESSAGKPETKIGYFTGTNVTSTEMWGVTLPLLVTYCISPRWNVSAGPYMSCYFKQTFTGEVYENKDGVGYLRNLTPVGEKTFIGSDVETHYDFSADMLPLSAGVELCFDWKAMRHMNVFGKLDWGLTNIWRRDFDAISFRMYPIYGTIGVAYRY